MTEKTIRFDQQGLGEVSTIEAESPSEILGLFEEEKLLLLSGMWGRMNAFGDSEHDEFFVVRENGVKRGIFKNRAYPVIPFLSGTDGLRRFQNVSAHLRRQDISGGFEEELRKSQDDMSEVSKDAVLLEKDFDSWTEASLRFPEKFISSLEKARVDSSQIDRRLVEIFEEEDLSEDPKERIVQLVNRLTLGFGLLSPFYNLEAILGDSKGFKWNPISIAQETLEEADSGGGGLDIAGLYLPSLLRDQVEAEKLDWNGLTWEQIDELTGQAMQDSDKARAILRISELTNSSPREILFAANALEWIPGRPGGKKDDFDSEINLSEVLSKKPSENSENEHGKIIRLGRDMNAFIRFMNWIPIKESQDNFDSGTKWSYASVCDASTQLLQTVQDHPELWNENFREDFQDVIAPQLDDVDAQSAKGRILLELILEESRMSDAFSAEIVDENLAHDTVKKLVEKRKDEYISHLGDGLRPRQLIGGKIFGLEELVSNLPIDVNVPHGIYINAEATEDLLRADSELWSLILKLGLSEDIEDKVELGNKISGLICQIEIPRDLLDTVQNELSRLSAESYVVRSSSFDEDGENGDSGAGVYESFLDIVPDRLPDAIKSTIASFFSENAVRFRSLHGHSDYPRFATLIQPFIQGVGGVAHTRDIHNNNDHEIVVGIGESADLVTSGRGEVHTYSETDANVLSQTNPEKADLIKSVCDIVQKTMDLKGQDIDMEWIQDKEGILWILQLRGLPFASRIDHESVPDFSITLEENESLKDAFEEIEHSDGSVSITLNGERNLDTFQGELFTLVVKHGDRIAEIRTEQSIPITSHFSNICSSLGIKLINLDR